MSYKLFLDTDVVIDYFTDRSPFADDAAEIFELNERKEIQLFLSAVSINNIYYIVRKFLGHKKSLQVIEDLINRIEVVGTNKEEILQALRNKFSDFEDSIQYSSALKIEGLNAIITRNVKDFKNSSIAVLTPTDFLRIYEARK